MKRPLTDPLLERIAERFRILSEPARLRLLRRLMQGEASAGDLADAAGLSQANASKHLSILLAARVVARRAEGTSAVYRLDDPSLAKLCEAACEGLAARLEAEKRAIQGR